MSKDGIISTVGPIYTIQVEVIVSSDAQIEALEKFIQATPIGRGRMLAQAEAQSKRESVIVMDGE